jgi:hypothetical protein
MDGCAVVLKGGEVVLVGVPMVRRTDIYAQELMNRVFRNMVVLRSGSEWGVTRYPAEYRPNSVFGNMTAALRWLAEGSINVAPIYEVVQPTDPQGLYQDILNKRTKKLAQVIDWTKLAGKKEYQDGHSLAIVGNDVSFHQTASRPDPGHCFRGRVQERRPDWQSAAPFAEPRGNRSKGGPWNIAQARRENCESGDVCRRRVRER